MLGMVADLVVRGRRLHPLADLEADGLNRGEVDRERVAVHREPPPAGFFLPPLGLTFAPKLNDVSNFGVLRPLVFFFAIGQPRRYLGPNTNLRGLASCSIPRHLHCSARSGSSSSAAAVVP